MEHAIFYVGDRPQVYWDPTLKKKNLQFLRGLSPQYYAHLAKAHSPFLGTEANQEAAAALRIGYAQGLEAFFAIACACMQSPDFALEWMLSYKPSELHDLVEAVSSSRRMNVHPHFRPASWESLAVHVLTPASWESESKTRVQVGFGRLWARLARDFSDECLREEYNSLKHGSRPTLGGFALGFGLQPSRDVPAPPEAMHWTPGSEYGSTYFKAEPIAPGKLHWRPRRQSLNWVPENLLRALELIFMSIQNVTTFLRLASGDNPQNCRFVAPEEEGAYEMPWAEEPGFNSFNVDTVFGVEHIKPWSKEEVRKALQEKHCSGEWTSEVGDAE